MQSQTLRRIFACYHQVEIGLYSYGGCFNTAHMWPFTRIGRYCSFAENVYIYNRNHPIHFKSTHPLFWNLLFGYIDKELVPMKEIVIGNDVWVGQNAIILPSVTKIGDGAVVGAGAVVAKDVPDYAVVVGVPAKVIKYRFSQATIQKLKQEQWWNKSIEELKEWLDEFTQPLEGEPA